MIKFVFILILFLVLFYLNQYMFVEMFSNMYQTFQTFQPFQQFQQFQPFQQFQQSNSFVPINGYKYPINQNDSWVNFPINWFYKFLPISDGYTNLPWWNTSLGNTRNMSYDLRGDPVIIPKTNFVWNNSSIFPIHNRGI